MQPRGHLAWRAVLGQPFHAPERAAGDERGADLIETVPACQAAMSGQYPVQQFAILGRHDCVPSSSVGACITFRIMDRRPRAGPADGQPD
ncbi:hypothetical protein D9M72_580970 [compost metagenome]